MAYDDKFCKISVGHKMGSATVIYRDTMSKQTAPFTNFKY